MGMAGGAYQGDKERAQMALQAAQVANANRAQEQALALRRAQLSEEARQADMADARANRALDLQEGGRNQPVVQAPQRPTVSSYSNVDALSALRQAAEDRRLMQLESQNNMLGQMEQVIGVEKKQRQARVQQGQATMASIMKIARQNGGTAPVAALNFANRQFGFDGKSQAIGSAGFMQNGGFFIDFLQKDPNNGAIARNTQTIDLPDMGRILYSQQGIFNNEDRARWRKQMIQAKYSTEEVNTLAGLNATAIESLDDEGRQRLDAGYADASGDDWKRKLAERKMALQEQKVAASLGQKSLDAAQKFALYHFNDFAQPTQRAATEADVKSGAAKKVGETVYERTSPDQAFKAAVDFYNKNSQMADPAVNPPADGGAAKPAEPIAAPANTNQVGEATAAPAAVEGAVPENADAVPETDKTDPEETPDVPETGDGVPAEGGEDGQGEFEFGGAEGADVPADGGEAPVEGGEPPAPPAGGNAKAPVEGGAGAQPPPAQKAPAPEATTMAGAAGGVPGEKEDAEDESLKDNPFAKWIKRGKKTSK